MISIRKGFPYDVQFYALVRDKFKSFKHRREFVFEQQKNTIQMITTTWTLFSKESFLVLR